jgi:hypothetical protein
MRRRVLACRRPENEKSRRSTAARGLRLFIPSPPAALPDPAIRAKLTDSR